MASTKQQVVTLFRGSEATPRYVWSPFVDKLEARLRIGGLSYNLDKGSPISSPRGKIPYISIAIQGSDQKPEFMSDTTLIISSLVDNGMLQDWSIGLTSSQKAYDMALRALLEEKLYFFGVFEKWCENYYTMRDHTFAALPFPVRFIVGNIAYRRLNAGLYGQGTSRFTPAEIQSFRTEIWETINQVLVEARSNSKAGNNKDVFWALGLQEPTELDATLYGFIASGLVCSAAPATQQMIRSHPAIVDYARRIHDRYFPDYQVWD